MSVKKVITANQAAGWGAYLSRAQVAAAYPITPQTTIIETLASLMLKAQWKHKFMTVESEHSAMAACIAASLTGARVFTATSSQGLLLMHELLHWAGGGRIPIVMVNVNRAIAPGWNIWTDQQDSLSQRDTGWIQIYCANAQEVLDHVILAYRLAETVQIPAMVVLDAFYLSHTAEAVEIPDLGETAGFLAPRKPAFEVKPGTRQAFGEFLRGEQYQNMRRHLADDFEGVWPVWERISREFDGCFGRSYPAFEGYRLENAEVALVTSATPSSTARLVVDELRDEGIAAGLARLRFVRPFPDQALRKALKAVPKVVVLDRSFSWGSSGILAQETSRALYGLGLEQPRLYSYVYGLGGADVVPGIIRQAFENALRQETPSFKTVWLEKPGRKESPPARRALRV